LRHAFYSPTVKGWLNECSFDSAYFEETFTFLEHFWGKTD